MPDEHIVTSTPDKYPNDYVTRSGLFHQPSLQGAFCQLSARPTNDLPLDT